MRFDLDAQQRAFQSAVSDYLEAECPPDRALRPHDTREADYAIWKGLMDLGLGAVMVPEAHGGLGLGLLDLAVAAEEVGRHAAPGPFLDHALGVLAIVLAGDECQKARWLPALATGEMRATIALAEAGGWAPGDWGLDGETRLSGDKRFVLHAENADLIVAGLAGGRLGVIAGDAPGVTATPVPSTDAGRTFADVRFDDAPMTLLPVAAGQRLFDAGLILLAAEAYGGASRCVDMAVGYAKERQQFGRLIGEFQALKHQLADMAVTVEPAIGLYWYAAHVFDTEPARASEAAALAKAHVTELYPGIARRMIEAHGGIGYTWEYPAHVWLKRALFSQAYLGMPRHHRARAAQLLGW